MEVIVTQIKAALIAVWAVALSALAPTGHALFLLVAFGLFNMFIGYQSNLIIKKEKFSFRKMWRALQELMFYMCLTIFMHLAFFLFEDQSLAEIAVRTVCWVGVWGYLVKILENAKKVFPKNRSLKLLYYIAGIKFIPWMLERFGVSFTEEDMEKFNDGTKAEENSAKG